MWRTGVSLWWFEGKVFQAEGTADANALSWEWAWEVGDEERKPGKQEVRESGRRGIFLIFIFNILAMLHGIWDLSFLARDQTHVPCFGRQILNHWTTRKVSVQGVLERTAASSNLDVIVYMNTHSPCFAAQVELDFSKLEMKLIHYWWEGENAATTLGKWLSRFLES